MLHLPEGEVVVSFRNNRLILFEGMIPHEVTEVRCPGDDYMDRRFSIQYRAPRQ